MSRPLSKVMVDTNLKRSKKLHRLGDLLGVGRIKALGYLVSLWIDVMVERETGELEGWSRQDLERAAGWSGRPGRLASALVREGWVDKNGTGQLSIHDWEEHQGSIIEERKYEAAKKRRQRAHAKGQHCADCPPNCPGGQSGDSPAPILTTTIPSLPIPSSPSQTAPFQPKNGVHVAPAAEAREGHPILDTPDYRLSMSLLLLIGFKGSLADDVATKIRVRRVLEVVEHAKGQANPGGWAREAFKGSWEVPALTTKQAEDLVRKAVGK